MDKSQVFVVVGIAAVSLILVSVAWSVLTSPKPYVVNTTNGSTATDAIGVMTVIKNGYIYSNYTKAVPCKEDPGVVCFVPVTVKLPMPTLPPNMKILPPS